MKKLLLLLIIPFLSFGQGWVQVFEDDDYAGFGYSVQQTTDNGYIVAATVSYNAQNAGGSAYLIKTNNEGSPVWTQFFNPCDYGTTSATSVQQTTDGGYIISGTRNNLDCDEVYSDDYWVGFLLKTDSNGIEQWSQNIGMDTLGFLFPSGLVDVKQTDDGGYISVGYVDLGGVNNLGPQVFLVKTDSEGNIEWLNHFGGEGVFNSDEFGYEVKQTNDGGYVIVGETEALDDAEWQSPRIYIIKTDSEGIEEWYQTFGWGIGTSIMQADDGGYIIYGSGLLKITEDGEEEWWSLIDEGYSVEPTNDGGCILTTINGFGITKANQFGEQYWSQELFSDGVAMSVQQTNDDGFIVCGGTTQFYFSGDIRLVKTDSSGNITFTNIIEAPTINKNLIKTIDILGRETNQNKGVQLHIYDDGTVEKKYLTK